MDKVANPAPLGLLGFGMTTILLNLHNVGLYPLDSMILAMGLAYGGLAQITAGIMEYKRGNTFGTLAFSSYGMFWWSLILLLILPKSTLFSGILAPTSGAMAAYFCMWGIFTFMMYLGTLHVNLALQSTFLSLALLFFLLAVKDLTGSAEIGVISGYEGVFCGLSAIYTAFAEVFNEVYGKTVLPLFPIHSKQHNSEGHMG